MRFFFDFIIIFSILISAYWMYVIVHSFFCEKKKQNTVLIRSLLLLALLVFMATIFYGSFIEPRQIAVKKTVLESDKLDKPITLVFLTDFHVGDYKKQDYISRIVEKVREINPDLVLLGGDYILNKEQNAEYLAPLQELSRQYPILGIMGNHEYNLGDWFDADYQDKTGLLRELFKKWHIKILENENESFTINQENLAVAGIQEIWTGYADLVASRSGIASDFFTVILAHNPDAIMLDGASGADLILSGHTHGGQIRLPWLGSVASIPNELGRAYDKGLFELPWGGYLYVSAGLGESGTRARLFNPPEISVIEIR